MVAAILQTIECLNVVATAKISKNMMKNGAKSL